MNVFKLIAVSTVCLAFLGCSEEASDSLLGSDTVGVIDTFAFTTEVVGFGTITPESGTVIEGDYYSVEVVSDTGYKCDSIVVDGINEGNPSKLYLEDVIADQHVIAYFSPKVIYTITTEFVGAGTVSPDSTTVFEGDDLLVAVTANIGYECDSVVDNGINEGALTLLTLSSVSSNHKIVAYFKEKNVDFVVNNVPASRSHPKSDEISVEQVPMFISFGFDDNGIADVENNGGATWILNYLKDKTNPDGTPMRASFYMTAKYGREWVYEDDSDVREAWQYLYADGHEIGNHSTEHLMHWDNATEEVTNFGGKDYTTSEWLDKEILECQELLLSDKVGIAAADIKGWRTPRLEWNNALFTALINQGFIYDCSIESDSSNDGTDNYWPFTLDDGHPEHSEVSSFKGFWEMPAYRFHIPENLRSKTGGNAAMTGLDYNVWVKKDWGGYEMTGPELTQILIYTLDQRMAGNRAPMLVGLHSDIYTDEHDKSEEYSGTANARARQLAIENFVDYATTTYPEAVRFVPTASVINWMNDPKAL
jgi:hypothetical protein